MFLSLGPVPTALKYLSIEMSDLTNMGYLETNPKDIIGNGLKISKRGSIDECNWKRKIKQSLLVITERLLT